MSFRYRHGDRPLDGYTIQRGVGRGAFGEVYYAISDGGREVALKTILQNHEIELRGVQHCINLKSPHLVSIFDVRHGEDGLPVVIMEYVAGPSLRDLIREFPNGMQSAQAAYLLREIGRGLSYLHEHGIVHRDLKPENLFFEDGYVKIGDYGLSKYVSVSRQSGQTMSVGTVHYMAPEIGSGIYNQQIDIYALGIILHELLTGKVPFGGASFGEILMKHLTAKPDLSGVSEPFRSVVQKALEKKPEDRYATVDEMCGDVLADVTLKGSLHSFNPASLSVAAKRLDDDRPARDASAGPSPADLAGLATTPLPARPASAGPAEGVSRERAPAATVAPDAPRDHGGVGGARDAAAAARSTATKARSTATGPESAVRGRDLGERITQALVMTTAVSAGVAFVTRSGPFLFTTLGQLVAIAAGVLGVLVCHGLLSPSFIAPPGMSRRFVQGSIALVGGIVGFSALRLGATPAAGAITFAIAIAAVDWSSRLDPGRPERFSASDALLAGLLGFFFGLFSGPAAFVIGACTASVSLALNALAPHLGSASARSRSASAGSRSRSPAGAGGFRESRLRDGAPAERSKDTPAAARPAARTASSKDTPMWVEEIVGESRRRTDPAWQRVADAVFDRDRRAPVRPGAFARIFWLFISALLAAAAISCFAAPWAMRLHGDETLGTVAGGIACLGFLGFTLYRAIWARQPGFLRRTFRPFLLVTLGNVTIVAAYVFVMGPIHNAWRLGSDESVVALSFAIGAFVVLSLALAFERLIESDRAEFYGSSTLPWTERPVHPVMRFLQMLLAGASTLAAIGLIFVGLFGQFSSPWHRLELVAPGVGAVGFALFFAHQALRRRRGYPWEGTVRPFIVIMSLTALMIVGLFFVLPEMNLSWTYEYRGQVRIRNRYLGLGEEERFTAIVAGIVAAVFGVFALFIRGKGRDLSRSRLFSWRRDSADDAVHSAWISLGTLFWLAALAATLACATLRVGFGELLGLEAEIGAESYALVTRILSAWWVPVSCALLGSASVIFSRISAGGAHLTRGFLGQVALHVALHLALTAASLVTVTQLAGELVFHSEGPVRDLTILLNALFASALLGALLLAWPRAETASRLSEPVGR